MPYKDKDKQRAYQSKWVKKNRIKQNEYIQKMKIKAYKILGEKCINCGCDDIQALEFNHKNGGGAAEYRAHGGCQKQLILDIVAGRRKDIELTCRVCNALHYLVKLKGLKNKWKVTYES